MQWETRGYETGTRGAKCDRGDGRVRTRGGRGGQVRAVPADAPEYGMPGLHIAHGHVREGYLPEVLSLLPVHPSRAVRDPQRREGAEGSCRYRVQGDDCHRQVDVVHLSVCGALHGNGVSVPENLPTRPQGDVLLRRDHRCAVPSSGEEEQEGRAGALPHAPCI